MSIKQDAQIEFSLSLQLESAVRDAANSLFQLIGAAHTVLTDPIKRRELDIELDYANMYGTNSNLRPFYRGPNAPYHPPAYNAYNPYTR